jgi:hypothetical protein
MTRRELLKALGGVAGVLLNPASARHLIWMPEPGSYIYGKPGEHGHVQNIWRSLVAGRDMRAGLLVSWDEGEFLATPHWKFRNPSFEPSRIAVLERDVVAGERFLGRVRGSCYIRVAT